MKRSRSKSSWPLISILAVISALIYIGYQSLMPKQSAQIFAITPTTIEYGDTSITGIIRKDTPVGVEGNYLLILEDSRPVLLDAQGLDAMLGLSVTVSGYLIPAVSDAIPMTMNVTSMSTN